jgi:hypothetical protein
MKKLIGMFLWFCAATVIAQACIVGLAFSKGNFTRQTITEIIAKFNGIDIQGKRLETALVNARATPSPTYQDVLDAKTNAALQMDSRSRALDNYQRRLDDSQKNLQEDIKRFDERRAEFNAELDRKRSGIDSESLNETRKLLSALSPEQTKAQLASMLEKGQKSDVVAIVRGMAADVQKKVLAEFTGPDGQERLSEIIEEIRNGEAMKSLIDNAKKG